MSDATLYYKHSGRFTPAAAIITLLGGLITAIVLGAIYGIIVFYMPIVYVNVLLTFGVGIGVGITIRKVAMAQQIRSTPLVLFIGLLCGIATEYAAFVAWVAAVASWNYFVFNPHELYQMLEIIAEQGVWSLKSSTVKGGFLVFIWIVEAVVVIGGAVYLAWVEIAGTPYCENCAKWLTAKALVGPFQPIKNAKELRENLEQGDFAALGSIEGLKQDDPISRFAEYELTDCPTCDETAVVTIRNVILTADKEGKVTRKDDNIIRHLLIDKASCVLIKELQPKPEDVATDAGQGAENDPSQVDANAAALAAADQEQAKPSA